MYGLLDSIVAQEIRDEQNKHVCFDTFENCAPEEIQIYKQRLNMLELDITREIMIGNIADEEPAKVKVYTNTQRR